MALLEQFNSPHAFQRSDGYLLITEPEEMKWPDDPEPLDDATALKIVIQDKANTTTWLQSQGWVLQWQREERLYLFKVPTRTWDGTSVPRSALGMPLVYETVESVLPQLTSAIFGDDPPFNVSKRPNTSADAARATTAILRWELKQAEVKEETRLGLKYMLIHGTGIWKYGWERVVRKRTIYERRQPYRWHPTGSGLGPVLLKPTNAKPPRKKVIEEVINRPFFEHRNLRYVLVDPHLRSNNIQKAKFVIDLMYPSIEDLDALRDYEGYKIPSRDELMKLMFQPRETPTQNPLEQPTLNLFQEFHAKPREEDSTVDPTQKPLEMAEYWTKDRVFTVLQGKVVIRNEKNPFGKIPFLSSTLADVLGYFYGIGFANLIGNEQRLQQGVINGYIDDFALTLNGMFTRVRGSNVLAQQLRMRPGGVIDTDTENGVGILPRQPLLTGDVMSLLESSDARAARRTAASESGVQGVMPSKNSSITRTATGVSALTSGTGTRLQYVVDNFATNVFVPLLIAFQEMNVEFLDDEQINTLLTKELGIAYQGDTLDIVNGEYDFEMLAGSKLQAKQAMSQALPLLYQFLLTAPVLESLSEQGKKVNIGELVKTTFDVTGFPNYNDMIVDMTPDEIQQKQANSPAALQAQQQQAAAAQQQQAEATKAQLLDRENTDKTGREVIRELLRNKEKPAVGLPSGGSE